MKMLMNVVGEGSPVVLVPGGLTGWLSWEPHAKRLSSGRKVVRVQLLNVQYGFENRPLPPDYSVRMESKALETTLTELEFGKPVDIVAWSFGAAVTLDYALNNPESIRSLTLIEPPAIWLLKTQGPLDDDTTHVVQTLQELHGDITEAQLEVFCRTAGLLTPSQTGRQLPQWPLWLQYRQSLRNSPAVIAHTDDPNRLSSFRHPVLLVKGTGSAGFLHRVIDRLEFLLPDAKVVEMPAGHAPQIVSIDRFLEELDSFHSSVAGR